MSLFLSIVALAALALLIVGSIVYAACNIVEGDSYIASRDGIRLFAANMVAFVIYAVCVIVGGIFYWH